MSFDIDGLSFDNCPHTGTPVCGGLSFNKAVYLVACGTSRRTLNMIEAWENSNPS